MADTDPLAAERLTEFARQWWMKRDADPDGAIYSIHFDRDAEPAVLNINDVEAVLAEVERLRALVAQGVEAFRLTREYLGDDVLPAVEGWSWFDWTQRAGAEVVVLPEAVKDEPPKGSVVLDREGRAWQAGGSAWSRLGQVLTWASLRELNGPLHLIWKGQP